MFNKLDLVSCKKWNVGFFICLIIAGFLIVGSDNEAFAQKKSKYLQIQVTENLSENARKALKKLTVPNASLEEEQFNLAVAAQQTFVGSGKATPEEFAKKHRQFVLGAEELSKNVYRYQGYIGKDQNLVAQTTRPPLGPYPVNQMPDEILVFDPKAQTKSDSVSFVRPGYFLDFGDKQQLETSINRLKRDATNRQNKVDLTIREIDSKLKDITTKKQSLSPDDPTHSWASYVKKLDRSLRSLDSRRDKTQKSNKAIQEQLNSQIMEQTVRLNSIAARGAGNGVVEFPLAVPANVPPLPLSIEESDNDTIDQISRNVETLGESVDELTIREDLSENEVNALLAELLADASVAAAETTEISNAPELNNPAEVAALEAGETCNGQPVKSPFDAEKLAEIMSFNRDILKRVNVWPPGVLLF